MVPLARKNIYWDCRARFICTLGACVFHKYLCSAEEIVLQAKENENARQRNENATSARKKNVTSNFKRDGRQQRNLKCVRQDFSLFRSFSFSPQLPLLFSLHN
jgi:hypothetical protein